MSIWKVHMRKAKNSPMCGESCFRMLTSDPLKVTCQWCLHHLHVKILERLQTEKLKMYAQERSIQD